VQHRFGGHGGTFITVDQGHAPNPALILSPSAQIVKLIGYLMAMHIPACWANRTN
jgi:hypothetical protein